MTSIKHLKNGRSAENSAYAWKGTTLRMVVASRQTVFYQMAAPVPEIMEIRETSSKKVTWKIRL
jgi:hypothetical protein